MKFLLSFLFFSFLAVDSYCQLSLVLSNCSDLFFEIDDYSDSDGDGNVCETNLMLQNMAMYTTSESCVISTIRWNVFVDLDSDGTYDLEYSSDLPVSDINMDDTNGNGIPDLYINPTEIGASQSIVIENVEGAYSELNILWQIEDECETQANCVQEIIVEDKKAPAAICSSVQTYIYDGFDGEIFARDFSFGAFDNCTDMENIGFSFSLDPTDSVRVVNCNDVLNSPVGLNIYFFDENDNVDFCTAFLNVIPTENVDCYPSDNIHGFVKDENGEPMGGVEVYLDCTFVECPRVTETDENGYYSFIVEEDLGSLLTLTASFDDNYLTKVTTIDLVKIVRHILGLEPFETPYQYIAADLNSDNKVKASDLSQIRRLILGVITELPFNTSWRFVNESFEFPNYPVPIVPISGPGSNPFSIDINPNYDGDYNFIGVKIGNIEG